MYESSAIFSPCKKYRYLLTRIWAPERDFCLFVCLNPSTADETIDDPTVRKCIGFSKRWGYGGMKMTNLFALRSTNPKKLYSHPFPIGFENNKHITEESEKAGITIAAWGVHGKYMNRGNIVMSLCLNDPHYLALTIDNYPKHPLYLKKDLKPIRYYKD